MKQMTFVLSVVLLALVAVAHPGAYAQTPDLKPEQYLGGAPDAPIIIEVFSDFECTSCRAFYLNTIRQVLKDYCSQDKVAVAYYEFPLQGNKYSRQAALYARAAQKLGRKQWIAVMDGLYMNQEKWSQDGSVDDVVFKSLGADDYFSVKKRLLDPAINAEIDRDIALGKKREVNATPTFFITAIGTQQKIVGAVPYFSLKDYFDHIVK